MHNVLIIGKESYIGEALNRWLKKSPELYYTEIVSPRNNEWKKTDFSRFTTVVHLAGIAHINKIPKSMKSLFYRVNRDLTIEIGKYAKEQGVKHFVYFSSMNVYGDNCERITDKNTENPTSFYGDSKLQGEIGLRKLEDKNFIIAYIRPPFVYGNGCKGNYHVISKIAKKTPIFPTYKNKKSMIYIDNLCEFVRRMIDDEAGGIFTPQNKELVSTSDLVKEIAKVNRHKVFFTGGFNFIIPWGIKWNKNMQRAFINDYYDLPISNDYNFEYCIVDFRESIKRTEE